MGLVEDEKNGVVRQPSSDNPKIRAEQEKKAKAAREENEKKVAAKIAEDQKTEQEAKDKAAKDKSK